MEHRPPDYKNPYPDDPGEHIRGDVHTAYEAGYSDAGDHILSLLKEKAPSSVVIDILECRK
jgi:hypothetical protein|tara:strand:+ start:1188 stop:1370 length:183 start_codon:yes stop_codon:yes gene_type:complete